MRRGEVQAADVVFRCAGRATSEDFRRVSLVSVSRPGARELSKSDFFVLMLIVLLIMLHDLQNVTQKLEAFL